MVREIINPKKSAGCEKGIGNFFFPGGFQIQKGVVSGARNNLKWGKETSGSARRHNFKTLGSVAYIRNGQQVFHGLGTICQRTLQTNPSSIQTTYLSAHSFPHKNRYPDILASDQTRVRLPREDDYINASRCQLGEHIYIMTQAPLPNTVDDFWEMIFHQRPQIILMLTREVEDGRKKSERYWPEVHKCHRYGTLDVQCATQETRGTDIFVRQLRIARMESRDPRPPIDCAHIQYLGWPDHGTPPEGGTILGLLALVERLHTDPLSPLVIHCSAGIGRSGTFAALHHILSSHFPGPLRQWGLPAGALDPTLPSSATPFDSAYACAVPRVLSAPSSPSSVLATSPASSTSSSGPGPLGLGMGESPFVAALHRELTVTVQELRRQRHPITVQTKDQYLFCHRVLDQFLSGIPGCLESTSPRQPHVRPALNQSGQPRPSCLLCGPTKRMFTPLLLPTSYYMGG
ncbi:tyrosine-protein phosphatase non-receptor type 11 [Paratrimastix pyriformis]|uniref:Tyrosine-protein phosphatase non-receptor type 11 n=1 Tax=Paratrimastix pyriformis TaxID=342808 RepID=A0ABQ8UDE4_9EUKA|nr:tyrosine-protein phosphatase non-receptor type 11 [Paratrimastix pyriformis]